MKNLILLIVATFFLTGCVLTEFASDYFSEMVDVNEYERAKEIDSDLCDPSVSSRLQKTRSKEWYDALIADCQSREESSVPLAN